MAPTPNKDSIVWEGGGGGRQPQWRNPISTTLEMIRLNTNRDKSCCLRAHFMLLTCILYLVFFPQTQKPSLIMRQSQLSTKYLTPQNCPSYQQQGESEKVSQPRGP